MSTATQRTMYRINRKRRTQRKLQGHTGLVDGPAVAAHLQACLDAGWTRNGISSTSGVSVRAIRYILAGQPTVQHDNATRLLAVRPDHSPCVPPLGSIRRIQALSRAGYTIDWTGNQAGCSHRHIYEILNGTVAHVDRRLAERFAEIYRRHEGTPGPSSPARVLAKSKGWPGPDAWDVDTIDDPNAQPEAGRVANFLERAAIRREEIIHLAWCGNTPEQILARLNNEVSIATVRQIVQEWRTGQKRDRKQVAA
ncbi:hypothetical protein ABT090_20820 [Streptomyces asoensis]|uniref:hypothetical protein n=1 Tax=Streptomyces asoensis TaxID=249586 RepID=UPI00332BB7AD